MTDTGLLYFWLSIVPFLLLTVSLSWYMGKLSGIAECNEQYGCYSVSYPLAVMFFILGVLPTLVLAGHFRLLESSSAPTIAMFSGFGGCMASLMLGWRYAVRQWRAQQADIAAAEKEKDTDS